MFYDLRLPDGSGGLNQRNRAAMAIKLGVGCIATAKTVTDRLTEAHRQECACKEEDCSSVTY